MMDNWVGSIVFLLIKYGKSIAKIDFYIVIYNVLG